MIEIQLLLLFMIVAAISAIEAKDMISSVIALAATGLGLCISFLLLKAPDLAITQLIAELLCLIILIRATLSKDIPIAKDGRWLFNTISTMSFIGIFLIISYFVLKCIPSFGATNFISSVILDFRAYDTLGEAAVLFCAVIGVGTVMRKIGKKD